MGKFETVSHVDQIPLQGKYLSCNRTLALQDMDFLSSNAGSSTLDTLNLIKF